MVSSTGPINVLNIRDYLGNLHQLVRAGPADRFTLLEIGSHLARYRLCDHDFEPIPVIVPPTPNKGDDYKKLSRVWNKAAKELEEAVNIFVIGYSFPESDVFFRHLYALGSFSQRSLNRFCVFDPDKTGILENRYRKLLALDSTYRFRYFSETFDQAIKTIRKEF